MSKRFSISGLGKVFGKVVPALLVAVGAFSGTADAQDCKGTAYIKVPDSWSSVYIYYGNSDHLISSSAKDPASGYYVVDLSTITGNTAATFIVHTTNANYTSIDHPGLWGISGSVYDGVVKGRPSAGDLKCPGAGNILYVADDPLSPGSTYQGNDPPSARYLYVKVPQKADWLWSIPMVRAVGATSGSSMKMVPGRCGWYFFVWAAPDAPASAEIYNSSGNVIGTGSLLLPQLLSDANPKLYYDADAGSLDYADPNTNGLCVANKASEVYFLVPEDKDWQSNPTMISFDGGKTGKAMTSDTSLCGWVYYKWGVGEEIPDSALIYFDGAELEDMVGAEGFWGTGLPVPIPLKQKILEVGEEKIYFLPDDNMWPDDGATSGWYTETAITSENITGSCTYELAAVIYDTDASLHPAFSCYVAGDGCKNGQCDCQQGAQGISATDAQAAVNACVGVTPGIVQDTLSKKKGKPLLKTTAMGGNGENCFISEAFFNQLFNVTPGVNEMSCYDLPFSRAVDGKWVFDSDYFKSNGVSVAGGFYPVEQTVDADITKLGGTPVPAARTKRPAQGASPILNWVLKLDPVENEPIYDLMCNGPGWKNDARAFDCTKKFNSGDDFNNLIYRGTKIAAEDAQKLWAWGPDASAKNIPEIWPFYKIVGSDIYNVTSETLAPGVNSKNVDVEKSKQYSPRWTSGSPYANVTDGTVGRNQQFCFESHSEFTFAPGLRFSFRGDDDIWVFIGGKLAVDLGGTHLAAPGYVNLDEITDKDGKKLVVGKPYDIDIFFCDRRTTMSNVRIKTNMYIKQSSGLSFSVVDPAAKDISYNVCWDQSGDGDCASTALGSSTGSSKTIHACGDELKQYGKIFVFTLETRGKKFIASLPTGAGTGWQYGGINLENPFVPIINRDKLAGLAPGSYRLVIDLCKANDPTDCDAKAQTAINLRVKGNLDVMTQDSKYVVNPGDDKSTFYENNTTWKFVDKGLGGGRVPVYVSAFADGGVDLLSAVGQKYTLALDAGMEAYASKTGDTKVTFPKVVGPSGIDTIWVYQDLAGMTTSPEKKTVKLKSSAVIEFYAPKLEFATPASFDSTGKVLSWTRPVTADPDVDEDGEMYYHWIGSDVDLYLLIVNPIDNSICTECNINVELGPCSKKVVNASRNGIPPFEDGVTIVSIRSSQVYMDSAATITVQSSDMPSLVSVTYGNLHFREPPVPYPQLVDLFDVRGKTLGKQSIPEPYFSESKDYLDGKADSIAIHYHRMFQPNPSGDYKDSLPHLICLNWDEDNLDKYDFVKMNVSTSARKDTAVQCSYIIDSVTIYNSFMARYKANGNKSDSVLTFVSDSTYSAAVKTFGDGKVLSFAAFMEKTKVNKMHFDGSITDRMAPVIVSARVDNYSDQLNRLTVTLSEPVKLVDETNKTAPFTFYMNSATEVAEANRYASPTANAAPGGLNTSKLTLVFDKTQSTKNPTPRLGDYIRFRADSRMWRDTSDISSDMIVRAESDSGMFWNSPTDYNSTKRLPSSWVNIVGDYSVEVSAIKLATMNRDIDAKKTPAVEVFTVPTTMGKDEIAALYPNTLGFIVKSDMASFMSKDSVTEKYFNEHPEALADVYFQYDVKYYTNLGTYVAGNSSKIYCKDEVNKQKYGKEYFGGKDCRSVQGNFYIAWNMLSDKKRLVGTGAYIAKLSSFVKLAGMGKAKGSKAEETDMWGAKRGKGIVK